MNDQCEIDRDRAHAREVCASLSIIAGNEEVIEAMARLFGAIRDEGRAEERLRCAKIADKWAVSMVSAQIIAGEIRARK